MIEDLPNPEIVKVRHLRYEKDGTRYEMLGLKVKGSFSFGTLGAITNGWLVIDHLNRKAYLFTDGYKEIGYIAEKLGDPHNPPSTTDLKNIQTLLHALIEYDAERIRKP